jgi:glycosyltransferase A (GT-A) superfamily protein (DUF2064 family)
MSTLLAMVVQAPTAGKVFPDLVGDLTADEAVKVYRASVMDMCEIYARLSVRSRLLLYGPKGARKAISLLASRDWRPIARKGSDRGETLIDLADRAFKGGHRRVLAVWPRAATLPPQFVVDAFDQLLIDDIVIGPTVDGDIYAVGFSIEVPHVFMGFDWTDRQSVFERLTDRVERLGLVLGLMPHWYGVDRPESLPVLANHLRAEVVADGHSSERRLAEVIAALCAERESGTIGQVD